MGSKKRSAWAKETAEFKARLGDSFSGDSFGSSLDDLFAQEDERREELAEERDAARRWKACKKKQRYASRAEAEDARAACEAHGTRGLAIYRCEYCRGWHLTSHPQRG